MVPGKFELRLSRKSLFPADISCLVNDMSLPSSLAARTPAPDHAITATRHLHTPHHTTAPLHKFAYIFRHHKALKWNWIYNFSNICGLELAPLHSIPVLMYRIILRLLSVSSSSLCIFCTPGTGTCHALMTTPGLCSAQKYVISPFLFPPGAAGGPQCYSVAGILIRKLQHTPLPGQPTHSPHCGDTTLPSYQQEEYPVRVPADYIYTTYSLQTREYSL